MLYDKRWDRTENKPDAFTLADFVGWLETKSPGERYDFDAWDGSCLMGQYMAERGRAWGPGKKYSTYIESCDQVFGDRWEVPVLLDEPFTFGAALSRARAALVSSAHRGDGL
jgi:hypothetical protein